MKRLEIRLTGRIQRVRVPLIGSAIMMHWLHLERSWIILATIAFLTIGSEQHPATAQTLNCDDDRQPLIGKIAFISARDHAEQIYLMNVDGTNLTQLTDLNDADLSNLEWSPNGKELAFVDHSDIFVLLVETGLIAQLTTNKGEDYNPAWSPDGKLIAYISDRDGPYDIWVMTARGANIRALTYDPRWEMTVAWTPDGTGIVFVPNSGADLQIWTVAWNENFKWQRPFLLNDVSYILHSVIDVNWSRDGKKLGLATDYGGYVINADSTGLRQIEGRETYNSGAPTWSPDSCSIAFASVKDGDSEIYVLQLASNTRTQITSNTWTDFSPAWQPTTD